MGDTDVVTSAATDEGKLSDDIDQLFELTRIIVLVISRHVPGLSQNSVPVSSKMTPESVTLVTLALSSLADSAAVFPSVIKADLHACILHIFSSILIAPACQESLVPNALPIFRRFISSLANQTVSAETVSQLRTMLRGVTAVIKNAQKREHAAAIPAEKNSLLAGTILLTSAAKVLPSGDKLVAKFVHEVGECLESAMTTKVAAGLSRSLILLPKAHADRSGASGTESRIASMLLPKLLAFTAHPSDIEGTEEARPIVAGTLVTFLLSLADSNTKMTAAAVIVPALLQRAKIEGPKVWPEMSARLLEFAKRESTLFKGIVGGMSPAQKSFVEEVLRRGGGASATNGHDAGAQAREEAAPSIALKMDF